jgi:hypothetical protein
MYSHLVQSLIRSLLCTHDQIDYWIIHLIGGRAVLLVSVFKVDLFDRPDVIVGLLLRFVVVDPMDFPSAGTSANLQQFFCFKFLLLIKVGTRLSVLRQIMVLKRNNGQKKVVLKS